ncbi:HNH endonuclease [Stenotrophomonas sp. STM01]|nr:HNH endonuclease [Stenotrophomonas sp. STM01]
MKQECWREVAGFEGRYEVSDHGRVRSIERRVPMVYRNGVMGTKLHRQRVLRLHTWGAKYPGIVLLDAGGERHRLMVHRMVAEAFIPNPSNLPQVNHIDADTMNSCSDNLEWCDQAHNVSHSYKIGNRVVGRRHHFSMLRRDARGHCMAGVAERLCAAAEV